MNDVPLLLLALLAGLALGVFFYGGLWWTVRRGLASPYAAWWFFASLLLRLGVVLAGFSLVGQGQWRRLLLCGLGLVIARLLVVRMTRPRPVSLPHAPVERPHAPQPR